MKKNKIIINIFAFQIILSANVIGMDDPNFARGAEDFFNKLASEIKNAGNNSNAAVSPDGFDELLGPGRQARLFEYAQNPAPMDIPVLPTGEARISIMEDDDQPGLAGPGVRDLVLYDASRMQNSNDIIIEPIAPTIEDEQPGITSEIGSGKRAAAQKTAAEEEVPQAEIDEALRAMQEVNPTDIINDYNREAKADADERNRQAAYHFRDQNTLLVKFGSGPFAFGIYKRDLVEMTNLLLNVAADMLVYKRLNNVRYTHVYEKIIENHADIETVLVKYQESLKKWQENYDKKNLVMKALTNVEYEKQLLLKPVMKFMSKQFSIVGANPFKQEIFLPLFIRYITEKITDSFESSLIAQPRSWYDFRDRPSYRKNEAGELVLTTPIPSLTKIFKIARYIINPFSLIPKGLAPSYIHWLGKSIAFFNPEAMGNQNPQPQPLLQSQQNVGPTFATRLKNGLLRTMSNLFTSRHVPIVTEFATLGLGAKYYDEYSNFTWTQHLLQNNQYFLRLLQDYRKEKESFGDTAKIKGYENKIQEFIKNGHSTNNLASLSKWLNMRYLSHHTMSIMTCVPLVGYLGYKAYNYYKSLE